MDIDEIASISYLYFEFLHSPPEITVSHPVNVSHGSLVELLVEMEDADGIDATCSVNYLSNNSVIYTSPATSVSDLDGTGFWSNSWLLPKSVNGKIAIDLSCTDWSDNTVNYTAEVIIDEALECVENCSKLEKETKDTSESIVIPAAISGILLVVIITTLVLRARNRGESEVETWQSEDTEPVRDERIPEGWTLEEFLDWLDGPMPEEWEEDQWELYKSSLEDLR